MKIVSDKAIDAMVFRAQKAQNRYGEYASLHEVLGVLEEEFMEFKQAVHQSDWDRVREEAIDIAAVCLRISAEKTIREHKGQI